MVRHQNLLVIIAVLWLALIIFAVKIKIHQVNANKNLSKHISYENSSPHLTAVYGSYIENQANLLDLWLPTFADSAPNGTSYPLIVFIHGGAWEGGDKSVFTCQSEFNSHGYAVASINYRLTQEAPYPAQIEDCKRAISWLRFHAKLFKIDPNRIGVWGVSAGGHLVALLGTAGDGKNDLLDPEANVSSAVQAVCDWCGPTDLNTIAQQAGQKYVLSGSVRRFLGGSPEDKPELALEASPVSHVHKGCPPFLIMHGQDDTVVPVGQSEELAKALKSAKSKCTLEIIPRANHNFADPKTINRVVQFFDAVLKKHI